MTREVRGERGASWRDESHREVTYHGHAFQRATSYFISRLPENHTEKDLWSIFQQFGRVAEVFIATRINKSDHKFGFVRFLDVSNKKKLEYELDQIRIGDSKIYASFPRFKRVSDTKIQRWHGVERSSMEAEAKCKRSATHKYSYAHISQVDPQRPKKESRQSSNGMEGDGVY